MSVSGADSTLRDRLLRFINALRVAGVSPTVAETLDATRAVASVGIARVPFREALAATLVKDEADRSTFDVTFDRFFAAPERQRPKRQRRPPRSTDDPGSSGASSQHAALRPLRPRDEPPPPQRQTSRRERFEPDRSAVAGDRLAHRRALARLPFQGMSAHQVEAAERLAAELAQRFRRRLSRRQRAASKGRLDMRRTLRRSISRGGVPLEPAFRRRRPGRPDLIALCDHSYSVTTASQFLVALLLPSAGFFRRVHLFAYVDRPVEISVEHGRLVPHTPLDLYARSDFGHVLVELWDQHDRLVTRNTVVLVLGDARNNRRPPRADLLNRIHARARRLVWLNPEPIQRWNTGDSVMHVYQRHCDEVLAAGSLHELDAALKRAFRAS